MAPRYSFGPTKDLKIDVGLLIIKKWGFLVIHAGYEGSYHCRKK